MRSRGIWAVTLLVILLLIVPTLTACQAATRAVPAPPTATVPAAGHSIIAWTAFSSSGASATGQPIAVAYSPWSAP